MLINFRPADVVSTAIWQDSSIKWDVATMVFIAFSALSVILKTPIP